MSDTENDCCFLSSYAHVLVCLAENPRARLREVADRVGVTERTASRLINRLEEAGFVRRRRRGRRNCYEIDVTEPLRHPIESGCTLEALLRTVMDSESARSVASRRPGSVGTRRSE